MAEVKLGWMCDDERMVQWIRGLLPRWSLYPVFVYFVWKEGSRVGSGVAFLPPPTPLTLQESRKLPQKGSSKKEKKEGKREV